MFNKNQDLGEFIFRNSSSMLILSGPNGEIYDANDTFLNWIGYSWYEFTRDDNPVTWIDISSNDASLKADIEQADACSRGEITKYTIRKYFIPKNSAPKFVELNVVRYPLTGNLQFLLVEVTELANGNKRAFEEILKIQKEFDERMEKVCSNIDILAHGSISSVLKWSKENPKLSIPFWIVISTLLFGRSVLEIINEALTIYHNL